MKLVFIKNSKVVAITATNYSLDPAEFDYIIPTEDFQPVDIGYTYDLSTNTFISKDNTQTKVLTKLEFLNRFTLEETAAFTTSEDPIIKVLFKKLELATYVDLFDSSTIQGIQYLVSKGILTQERASQILAG